MGVRRKRKSVPRARGSLTREARQAINQHVREHAAWYAPAVSAVAFFLFAHLLTLLAFFLMKSGGMHQEQDVHKIIVTWAVYGFLPLLLCSYLCFFAVARPVTGLLARKCSFWTTTTMHLVTGAVYGAAIGLALLLLLVPDTWFNVLLVFCIGVATGEGNWFFYRKLAVPDPVIEEHRLEEQPE